jgi:hypothetical protein
VLFVYVGQFQSNYQVTSATWNGGGKGAVDAPYQGYGGA